jgi:hypothetical protein
MVSKPSGQSTGSTVVHLLAGLKYIGDGHIIVADVPWYLSA